MRKTEIIDGVNQVVQAIQGSGLQEALDVYIEASGTGKNDEYPAKVLDTMKSYSIYARDFSDAAKTVLRIMGLSILDDSGFWSKLLNRDNAKPAVILSVSRAIQFTLKHLPKLIKLIKPTAIQDFKDRAERPTPSYANKDILSVLLIEEDDRFSSPDRLVEMLQSVNLLYEASLIIAESPHDKLGVIACDSGSDKSFDFMGAAKAVECVKEIILSLWDRVVFYREKKISEQIELIAKSLPIIEKISELEQQQKFGPEQGELLRRNIINGVSKFAASGAIIPEIEKNTHFNPRMLLAPEPKLLTTALPSSPGVATIPAPPVAEDSNGAKTNDIDELDLSQLNDKQREFLRSIVKTFRDTNTQETEDQNNDEGDLLNGEIAPTDE